MKREPLNDVEWPKDDEGEHMPGCGCPECDPEAYETYENDPLDVPYDDDDDFRGGGEGAAAF